MRRDTEAAGTGGDDDILTSASICGWLAVTIPEASPARRELITLKPRSARPCAARSVKASGGLAPGFSTLEEAIAAADLADDQRRARIALEPDGSLDLRASGGGAPSPERV